MGVLPEKKNAARFPRWWRVPAFVLIASFGLTAFATYYAARSVRLQSRQQFDSAVYTAQAAVQTRMESYLALLRGGTAFCDANPEVSREEFHKYVERLRLRENYPGIQGFGFSARVSPDEMEKLISDARIDGTTNFRIWPIIPGEDIHTIIYLEPGDKRNLVALGYNMYSEPVRRVAMQQARDSGTAVASGPVTLVQEIEGRVQPGFLIYAPVYEGGSVPPTITERRETLRGFIYAPFRANDLFENVFPQSISSVLQINIYDGSAADPDKLLYKSPLPPRPKNGSVSPMTATVPFTVAEHPWTMRFVWTQPALGWYLVPLIFAIGSVISLLLSTLTVSEARAKARAEVANERLTLSEQSLREAREGLEQHARQLEQRVAERTARLQETVRDLEAVLYHVAHDLRAPVRAMGSFASILRDDYNDRLDHRAIGYLSRISEAASRMDRLVHDLLSYGRLSQMPMELESVSLDKIISTVLSRAGDDLRKRSAEVHMSEEMPVVRANPRVLSDIISRLVDNAVKFVPEDRKPKIRIWAETTSVVRIYIEDNGIGIRPEYLERIFRVFERLHSVSAYPGTGIGLAVARKALDRMGGRIGVESTPDKGSTFWLELEKPRQDS